MFPIINPATYIDIESEKTKRKICPKCKGKGYLGELSFFGNKVCLKCRGEGVI